MRGARGGAEEEPRVGGGLRWRRGVDICSQGGESRWSKMPPPERHGDKEAGRRRPICHVHEEDDAEGMRCDMSYGGRHFTSCGAPGAVVLRASHAVTCLLAEDKSPNSAPCGWSPLNYVHRRIGLVTFCLLF